LASKLAPGTLFVVATPIGNLSDITLRALEVLGAVDVIFAEDTRHTRRFMTHHGLSVRLVSAHAHNERMRSRELVRRLRDGESVALVTDAGSPGVSDPGARLVAAAAAAGFPTLPVPGPSALAAAISVSGVPADCFSFAGFLPSRPAVRKKRLQELLTRDESIIFFEAPHRIRTTMTLLEELAPQRHLVACRELTKRFEEVLRGTPSQVQSSLSREKERGEWTVIVSEPGSAGGGSRRKSGSSPSQEELASQLEKQGVAKDEARKRAAFIYGGGVGREKKKGG
jgi:16S rRNA (cytidine1402-2'-O)-methyltransferase